MKKIIKPLLHSTIITLIFTILLVIMIILGYEPGIWVLTVGILELSFGLLWLFTRMGLFSSSQYGLRRYANSSVNRRKKKLGVFEEKEKREILKIKEFSSSADIEKDSKFKDKLRIYFVMAYGVLFILISLPWTI